MVPRELFTKRQLAWMGLGEPEKYRRFLPRLSRSELGSFADEYVAEEFDVEVGVRGGWGWGWGGALQGGAEVARMASSACSRAVCLACSLCRLSPAGRACSPGSAGPAASCHAMQGGPRAAPTCPAPAASQMELYPEVPEDQPLYNLRDTVPEIYENRWAACGVAPGPPPAGAEPQQLHRPIATWPPQPACLQTGGPVRLPVPGVTRCNPV